MKCRECNHEREVFTAQRYGGGNYRRAGRYYRSSICLACVGALLKRATPGHDTVQHWSVSRLRRIWADAVGSKA